MKWIANASETEAYEISCQRLNSMIPLLASLYSLTGLMSDLNLATEFQLTFRSTTQENNNIMGMPYYLAENNTIYEK